MISTPHITIYPERDFNSALYGNLLTKATLIFSKNLGYHKKLSGKSVNIHLGEEPRMHTGGSIKSIWVPNTIDTSSTTSDIDKLNAVLTIIFESLTTIGKAEGWDLELIEKAFNYSIANKGNFTWHSKLIANKNRGRKARIKVLFEEGKVPIIAEFFDSKSNFLFEVPIIETFDHFLNWKRTFSKPIWLDNEKFGFSLMDTQLLIYADSLSGLSEIVIAEKTGSREQIEGQLRMITFREFASRKEWIEWANK